MAIAKWDDTSDDWPGYLNSNVSDIKYLIPNGKFRVLSGICQPGLHDGLQESRKNYGCLSCLSLDKRDFMLGFPLQSWTNQSQDFPKSLLAMRLYLKCHCSPQFSVCRGSGNPQWRTCRSRHKPLPDHPSCLSAARSALGTWSCGCCPSLSRQWNTLWDLVPWSALWTNKESSRQIKQ